MIAHPQESDAKVLQLENNTVNIVLWLSITIAILVIAALAQSSGIPPLRVGLGALALAIIGTVVWSTNSKPESGTALACLPMPGAVNCELQLHF